MVNLNDGPNRSIRLQELEIGDTFIVDYNLFERSNSGNDPGYRGQIWVWYDEANKHLRFQMFSQETLLWTELQVGDPQKTAFGEASVSEPTPKVQVQFPYNINSRQVISRANQSGTVTQAAGHMVLQTGAAANSSGTGFSRQVVPYRPGQGGLARFTALFTTGVANSSQYAGIGDAGDGYFFGYEGAAFGIMRRNGGVPEIRTLTVTTADSTGEDITITLNSDAASDVTVAGGGDITVTANDIAAHDYSDVGPGWDAVAKGVTVIFTSWEYSAGQTGTYSLSSATSAVGTFAQTVGGAAPTETIVAQADWDDDPADGTKTLPALDPTKGNVYQIQYQWLGYGQITFSVEDPATGEFVHVHHIAYANANTASSVANPTLPIWFRALNTSNTSNLTLKTGSFAGLVEGEHDPEVTGLPFAADGEKTDVGNAADRPIITIMANSVYQSKVNRTEIDLRTVTVTAEASRPLVFTATKNAVLTAASFSDVDTGTSTVAVDTAATALSGGDLIGKVGVAKDGDAVLVIDDVLIPGETLTVSARAASATGHDGLATINWLEVI